MKPVDVKDHSGSDTQYQTGFIHTHSLLTQAKSSCYLKEYSPAGLTSTLGFIFKVFKKINNTQVGYINTDEFCNDEYLNGSQSKTIGWIS